MEPNSSNKTLFQSYRPRDNTPSEGIRPVIDGYEFEKAIGRGAMGVVWLAKQLATKRRVAVKLLAAHRLDSDGASRFRREVELASQLEHPGIARVYDSGLSRGQYYCCMEYIDGVPVDKYANKNMLTRQQRIHLLIKISEAVQYAHQHGVIHRDLKPTNILVTADGSPHILDFGLAKAIDSESPDEHMSMEGDIMGTPIYMSPEQALGQNKSVDTRSDVYSLGVMLYELITGNYPHVVTGSNFEILKKVIEEEPRSPRSITKDVDSDLEAILLKSVARDKTERYDFVGALSDDLNRYLAGDPLAAKPATTIYIVRRRLRKHRTAAFITLAITIVLIAMAVQSFIRIRNARDREVLARVEAEKNFALAREKQIEAEQARKSEKVQRVQAEERLYKSLLAEGNAFAAANQWKNARKRFDKAREVARKMGFNELPVNLSEWDLDYIAPAPIYTFKGHSARIYHAVFDKDGRHLVTCSEDGTVKRWDTLLAGINIGSFSVGNHDLSAMMISPSADKLLVGRKSGDLELWDLKEQKMVFRATAHQGMVKAVAFSPDGKTAATGGTDTKVCYWDLDNKSRLHTWDDFINPILCVAFSTDGKMIAAGSEGNRSKPVFVHAWRVDDKSRVFSKKAIDFVYSVSFSDDNKRIVYGTGDFLEDNKPTDSLVSTDLAQADLSTVYRGQQGGIPATFGDQIHNRLFSGSFNGTVVEWDYHFGTINQAYSYHESEVTCITPSSDDQVFATTSADGWIVLWPMRDQTRSHYFPNDTTSKTIIASHDGNLIAFGTRRDDVVVYDSSTAKLIHRMSGHKGSAEGLQFSKDNRRLFSVSWDGTIAEWDLLTGVRTQSIDLQAGPLKSLRMNKDGTLLFTSSEQGIIFILDSDDLSERHQFSAESGACKPLDISPDGQLLAVGCNQASVWNIETGHKLYDLQGHRDNVEGIAFSPDGSILVTASMDEEIRLWQADTGTFITNMGNISSSFLDIIFDPAGDYLFTGGYLGEIGVWDFHAKENVRFIYRDRGGSKMDLAFHPIELKLLIAAYRDNNISWDFGTSEWHRDHELNDIRENLARDMDASSLLSLSHIYADKHFYEQALMLYILAEKAHAESEPLFAARCAWITADWKSAAHYFEQAIKSKHADDNSAFYLQLCLNRVKEEINSSAHPSLP